MIKWNPDPVIFEIGPLALRWYSLGFMLAFYLGFLLLKWIFDKEKKPMPDLDQLFIYVFIATILGARLGHCLFYDPAYYLKNPIEILKVWKGGLASHGAAIAILIALYLYSSKRPSQPFLWLLDRISIVIALAGFFIRMGNLFNSEIIGRPADVPWAFVFTKVDMLPRHPTQLYEALAYLSVAVLLYFLYKRKMENTERGLLFGVFLVGVFGFRFFVEFFKENQSGFESGMLLNLGQLLSIPLVIVGIYLLIRVYIQSKNQDKL